MRINIKKPFEFSSYTNDDYQVWLDTDIYLFNDAKLGASKDKKKALTQALKNIDKIRKVLVDKLNRLGK